ncbi:hypothetical protein FI667_g710, partial [Globisporangium splendens]
MDLSAWCDAVAFGKYLQPIHLTVADLSTDADAAGVSTPAADPTQQNGAGVDAAASDASPASPSQSDQVPVRDGNSPPASPAAASPRSGEAVLAKDAVPATPPATPKHLKRRQKPPPSSPSTTNRGGDAQKPNVKVLAPFAAEYVQGCDRIAMNVGGPVWAMDWLPQDTSWRRTRKKQKENQDQNCDDEASDQNEQEEGAADGDGSADGSSAAWRKAARQWHFLALSTHPPCEVVDGRVVKNTPPDHYYNVQAPGARRLIQIWAIPVQPKAKNAKKNAHLVAVAPAPTLKPKLVYGIDHYSGAAWDLQWCPLAHTMPKRTLNSSLLGVLAVCFGDGSLQIFEVPKIPLELLTLEGAAKQGSVERLAPIVHASVPKIIQLSIQWSPHHWNLILTGGSDVSLWNLESELSGSNHHQDDPAAPESAENVVQIEPQRRYQDADAVGKQEAFEWGWGWVAVRSVAWSPFDEFIFATTGNDSIFKVWDIREPRICLRSHRIRSTWGLALQWMDHTTIQISGDQGSIYMYDILIDSPVWDLQFARRGDVPLLASCCTSGSIRVAPAKKMFRAPQNSIEICRLVGEKDANTDRPFKALTVDFEYAVASGNGSDFSSSNKRAMREFRERDAALHRMRLCTNVAGAYPCFLAVAGHAGLVLVMEIQDELDHLLENYFVQANKKLGRPRKDMAVGVGHRGSALWGSAKKKKHALLTGEGKKLRASGLKLPRESKKIHKALNKYKKIKKRSAVDTEFPQFEMKSDSEEEEEEEEDEDDEESELRLSLLMAEQEEDSADNLSILDDDFRHDDARMRSEYQLDLSEEDAMLLAIQMSELEQTNPTSPPAREVSNAQTQNVAETPSNGDAGSKKPMKEQQTSGSMKATNTKKASAKPPSSQKKIKAPPAKAVPQGASTSAKTAKKAAHLKKKSTSTPDDPFGGYIMDQAATLQIIQYQKGLSEEDALREAIRASEMEAKRATTRSKTRRTTTPQTPAPAAPDSRAPDSEKSESSKEKAEEATRRLVFSPPAVKDKAGSEEADGKESDVARMQEVTTNRMVEVNNSAAAAVPGPASQEKANDTQSALQETPNAITAPKSPKARPASSGKEKTAPKAPKTPTYKRSTSSGPLTDLSQVSTETSGSAAASQAVEVSESGSATDDAPSSAISPSATPKPAPEPEQQQQGKAKHPGTSSRTPSASSSAKPASTKRKRAATSTPQSRKRPSTAAGNNSSRGATGAAAAAGVGLEDGYLTDEEALYLALRASEVEY